MDFIIAETFCHLGEALRAPEVIKKAGLTAVITFTPASPQSCGAGPHHVGAMAEALGRTVPASEYSPNMDLHPILGDQNAQKKRHRECMLGPLPDDPDSGK